MPTAKTIIIPGSVRDGSFNVKLAHAFARMLDLIEAESTVVSLADYAMPILSQNIEKETGAPDAAIRLAAHVAEHQAVILINPEYNGSITPLMKNTLDWLSRDVGEKVYKNRVFALASSSPGKLGGIRGLAHMRDVLVSVGADMITPQIAVGNAFEAFTSDGDLSDEGMDKMLRTICESLVSRAQLLV